MTSGCAAVKAAEEPKDDEEKSQEVFNDKVLFESLMVGAFSGAVIQRFKEEELKPAICEVVAESLHVLQLSEVIAKSTWHVHDSM